MSSMFPRLIVLLSLILPLPLNAVPAAGEPDRQEVILWYRNYDMPSIHALLRLAFDKTPEYGPVRIIRSAEMNQGRALRELRKDSSDVIHLANVASTPERESQLRAIPIPIDGGLLGYRVCLIKPENQPLFEEVRTLGDLRESSIRFGQGQHWPDTKILRANGLEVITSSRFNSLYRMLESDRFECFARGVSEVLFDLEKERTSGLVVENHLMLTYDMPNFFFLSESNVALGHRIQIGLERAILDGSFAVFFDRYFTRAIRALKLGDRRVLRLGNPWTWDRYWPPLTETIMQKTRQRIQLNAH
ncbi:hypothetical protein [Tamilnaduibacter salinus]|nr:hypothetical protein [Tamilnaduibacter salinus]PAV26407.1 hypothetical protein CF392_06130 [Tamilnaduibacter salinus]